MRYTEIRNSFEPTLRWSTLIVLTIQGDALKSMIASETPANSCLCGFSSESKFPHDSSR